MILTGKNLSTRGRNLSQCLFPHQKSHMDWPGIEAGLYGERAATDRHEFESKD